MRKILVLALSLGLFWTTAAQATTLFSEDFSDPATAGARFDVMNIGSGSFTFNGTACVTTDFVALVWTNAANQFVEDGSAKVTYQVEEDMTVGSGLQRTALGARMDGSVFATCYGMYHYYDGSTGSVKFVRYNNDVETALFDSGTITAAQNELPVIMSITLENTATSVNWTIQYGSYSMSGSDTDANRITSGVATGLTYYNASGSNSCNFDNLMVTVVPEPATLSLLSAGAVACILRRKRK